jgi:dolichyl-phosphate beta-glucosyltransferase
MKPYLSVIIPAYNEAKRLPLTLIDIDKHLSGADYSYEIIVVDDGSKDATEEVVRRFSHLIKNLRLIDNKENHGKGWVVRQGMLQAKGDIRLFMDADNSTSIDQFSKMIPYLKEGYDVVIGSRDIKGAKMVPPQSWLKRQAGNFGNLIIQLLLLPGMWDTQCGFKAFTKEAALKIFSLMKINRWAFDVEALSLAKKLGYRIKEIPVVWVNNPFSLVKPMAYFQFFWEVLKIKWWIITRKYQNLKIKN